MPAGSPRFVFEKPHLFSAPGVKPGRAVLPAHPHPETPFSLLTDPDSAGPAHPAGGPWHTDSQSPAEISRGEWECSTGPSVRPYPAPSAPRCHRRWCWQSGSFGCRHRWRAVISDSPLSLYNRHPGVWFSTKFRIFGGKSLTKKQGPAAPHGEGRALLCPFTLQTGRMNGHTRRVTRESPAAGRPGP